MKNIFRIYKRDIKNIVTNWVALFITVALIILPSLYAWFNIKSSWDPYGNTQGIKVAIVNEDKGHKFADKDYNVGDEIVSNLKENDKIGWQFVDANQAEIGVKDGKYYASILIPEDFSEKILSITSKDISEATLEYTVNEKTNAIAPKITDKGVSSVKDEVSSEVVKTVDGIILKTVDKIGIEVLDAKPQIRKLVDVLYNVDSQMPELNKLIDEAQNGTIKIEELVKKVNGIIPTLDETITSSKDILNKSTEYINKVQSGVDNLGPIIKEDLIVAENVVNGIDELLKTIDENSSPEVITGVLTKVQNKITSTKDSLDSLVTLLQSINKLIHNKNLTTAIESLKQIQGDMNIVVDLVQKVMESVQGGVIDPAKLNALITKVENIQSVIKGINSNYDSTILPTINSGITELNKISSNGINILNEVQSSVPNVKDIMSLISKGTDLGKDELAQIKEKLPEVEEKLDTYVNKLKELDDEEKIDKILDFIINDWQKGSEFLSSPIKIEENKLFHIPNYGSAMSPFFTTLALWVGGLILVSLYTTHAKDLDEGVKLKSIEEYFGKYLTFISIAILQALVATLGDIYLLKTYVVHPVMFVLFGIFISIVFVTIIYSLVSVFGNIGKGIGVILLVLQISASGGTFPVEVMPKFFQIIHPLLPFKYAIGGMREAVAGVVPEILRADILYLCGYAIISIILGIVLKAFVNKHSEAFNNKLNKSGLLGH